MDAEERRNAAHTWEYLEYLWEYLEFVNTNIKKTNLLLADIVKLLSKK